MQAIVAGLALLGMAVLTLDGSLPAPAVLATVGAAAGILVFMGPQQDYDVKTQLRDLACAALAGLAIGRGLGIVQRVAESPPVKD